MALRGQVVEESSVTGYALGAGETWTGTWSEVYEWAGMVVRATTSGDAQLWADFSYDRTVTYSVQLSDGLDPLTGTFRNLVPTAAWGRIRVVDTSGSTNTITVQTIGSPTARISMPTARLSQALTDYSDVVNTRAALFGLDGNGKTSAAVPVSGSGMLVDVPRGAFGELVTTELTPRVQIDAIYGVLDTDVETFSSGTGSSTTATNGCFVVDSGTGLYGYGTIRSMRLTRYRPGEGLRARFTAAFEPGVASYISGAGLFTATDGIWVGYKGTAFGFTRRIAGAAEIRTLTVTVGATGAGTIAITLNGVATNVVIGGALSAAATAQTIAATTFAGWRVEAIGAVVTWVSTSVQAMAGAFTFAAGATGATATGPTQVLAGSSNDTTTGFVAQAAWNIDTLDGSNSASNPSGMTLDASKLNVYQIVYPYLGAGPILLMVMSPTTGRFLPVHRVQYPGTALIPSQTNPTYRVGWFSASEGSTTSKKVYGASGAIFVEGALGDIRNPFAAARTATSVSAEVALIGVRNGLTFKSKVNQREMRPQTASIAVAGTRPAVIRVYYGAILSGVPSWAAADANSAMSVESTNGLTVSGGQLVTALSVQGGSGRDIDLAKLGLRLEPGEALLITGQISGGSGNDISVAVNWQED